MKPLKFHSQLRETIWGGRRIASFKGEVEGGSCCVGESWELSGLRGAESVVRGGAFDGMCLGEVIARCGEELLGQRVMERFGGEFPLLIKFIDARDDLSIQVHPNDHMALERHGKRGKSEMWYIVDAEPESRLWCGWKRELNPEGYDRVLREGGIMEYLQTHRAKRGDVFYLPAGRVHSIGAGVLVAEIQQPSDLTYRIYDFDRCDKAGRRRELHTALAREAIDYRIEEEYRIRYEEAPDREVELLDTPEFTTSLYDLKEPLECDLQGVESFVALVVVGGSGELSTDEGESLELRCGEAVLIPASTCSISLRPHAEGLKLLGCKIR